MFFPDFTFLLLHFVFVQYLRLCVAQKADSSLEIFFMWTCCIVIKNALAKWVFFYNIKFLKNRENMNR